MGRGDGKGEWDCLSPPVGVEWDGGTWGWQGREGAGTFLEGVWRGIS